MKKEILIEKHQNPISPSLLSILKLHHPLPLSPLLAVAARDGI